MMFAEANGEIRLYMRYAFIHVYIMYRKSIELLAQIRPAFLIVYFITFLVLYYMCVCNVIGILL